VRKFLFTDFPVSSPITFRFPFLRVFPSPLFRILLQSFSCWIRNLIGFLEIRVFSEVVSLPICRHILLSRSHFFSNFIFEIFFSKCERERGGNFYTNFLKLREISTHSFIVPDFPICPFMLTSHLRSYFTRAWPTHSCHDPVFLFFLFFTLTSVIVPDRLYR